MSSVPTIGSDDAGRAAAGESASPPPPRTHFAELDFLRGLALLGMVASHLWWWTDFDEHWRILSRWVMPVFVFVSGVCFSWGFGRTGIFPWRRFAALTVAAGVTWWLVLDLGIVTVPILVWLCVGLLVMRWAHTVGPVVLILVSVVQVGQFPVPWDGYEPGSIVIVLGVAWLVADQWREELRARGQPLLLEQLWARGVMACGRWPLTLYVGHFFVLWILTAIVGH